MILPPTAPGKYWRPSDAWPFVVDTHSLQIFIDRSANRLFGKVSDFDQAFSRFPPLPPLCSRESWLRRKDSFHHRFYVTPSLYVSLIARRSSLFENRPPTLLYFEGRLHWCPDNFGWGRKSAKLLPFSLISPLWVPRVFRLFFFAFFPKKIRRLFP